MACYETPNRPWPQMIKMQGNFFMRLRNGEKAEMRKRYIYKDEDSVKELVTIY